MKLILLFSVCLPGFGFSVSCQPAAYNKKFFLSAGKSFAGSGDVNGFFIQTGLTKKIKRWNLSISQSTTVHDGIYPLFFELPDGRMYDGSMRYSVTGIQLIPVAGYSMINTSIHDLQVSLGTVIRYQSNGNNDSYVIFYPAGTGLPFPVIVFDNRTNLRTLSVGPVGQISYDYSLNSRWILSGIGSFQFDTNGDTFLNYGLRIGYRW